MANLQVTHTYSVNPNILALRIETGEIIRGKQVAYKAQPGDKVFGNNFVRRDGKSIGRLLENGKVIRLFDKFSGEDLNENWAKTVASYKVNGVQPKNVFIKSKIGDSARVGPWDFKFPMEHTVYIELAQPMKAGQRYSLDFQGEQLQDLNFTYSPETVRSEAVHISHLGFHPNDPSKVAFLSTWMGNKGQGLSYKPGQKFWLLDNNGNKVFEGKIELSKGKREAEDLLNKNYNKTDVYVADFSDFDKKGNYRVAVEGVGTSFNFKIGENVWEDAFQVSMEGLYAHRSGIKTGAPFSDYTAPRSFHPADGVKVYQSTAQFRYTDIGIGNQDTFKVLKEGATNEVLDSAWGGWKDAGDWDRNSNHMSVIRDLLELGEMFPDYFGGVNLTIPESGNKVADVIDEALWGLDFFQRIQREDGGVRGGVESDTHPEHFEASWQESQKVMAYSPDAWTSYLFAGVAARAAHLLEKIDSKRAKGYIDSAVRAMEWAEKEQAVRPDRDWRVISERNLAAAELYRATGGDQWHQMFLKGTVFTKPEKWSARHKQYDQSDAAFVYTQTNRLDVNKTVQANAKAALVFSGDRQLAAINNAGFRWSKNPHVKLGWGANDGFADRVAVTRAHFLTGEQKYLQGAVDAAQFQGGANPDNMSYTTGIGPRSADNVLFADGLAMGVEPPKGISLYGPVDLSQYNHWSVDLFKGTSSTRPEDWPTSESFFDFERFVPGTEYTVTETIAPTSYAWGYLAANHAKKSSRGQKTPTIPAKPTPSPEPSKPTSPPPTPLPKPPAPAPPEPPTDLPTPLPDAPAVPPLSGTPAPRFYKYEAEFLKLRGYRRKGELKGVASGNQFISLRGSSAKVGLAEGVFKGPAGRYRISVSHFDTAAGQSRGRFRIAGRAGVLRFNQDNKGDRPSANNAAVSVTHPSIDLKPGDMFRLFTNRDQGEYGAVDYVKFDRLGKAPVAATAVESVEASKSKKLVDLTQVDLDKDGELDNQVKMTFKVKSDVWFDNTVGFYAVVDENGAIADPISGKTFNPEDEGYRQIALKNRITDLEMDRKTRRLTATVEAGQILAPFIVANGTPEGAGDRTRQNMKTTYFAFDAANADGAEHIRGSGSGNQQIFGFEDHWSGGNKRFNDVVVNAEIAAI